MKFKACKHLDFNQDNYSCKLVGISNHLGWERVTPSGEGQLCQMCKLRGRLNSAQACIGKDRANCPDYEDEEFEIK